ncbi:MAG: gliding motility-associated C-terminal domain-containing protein [Saprospiraceae bacterium]|nr:gliding motility-associated C-terminal domain-containing protein [Saprospiraceae bacterium]
MRNGVIHVDDVYGGLEPYYYSLDGESFTTNPTFDRLWAGNYTLSVRDGSGEIKEWKITIKEPAALSVKLELSKDQISAGEPFGIRAITSAEREFLQTITWSPEELFIKQDTLRHWLSIFETTQISVQVTDQNGCVDSDILTVETGSTPLYFPNAINTGNSGDNGYFTLFAGEGVKQIASMQIYSRGGGLVFERNNFPPNAPGLGWNGRWDGRFVHPGVYPYLVMVEFVDGKLKRFQGTVTVVN